MGNCRDRTRIISSGAGVLEQVDVIWEVSGKDVSVAGRRAGLAGEEVPIAAKFSDRQGNETQTEALSNLPCAENVPGIFSSNGAEILQWFSGNWQIRGMDIA